MSAHAIPAVVTAMNLNGLGVARVLGRHGVPVFGIHGGEPGPELRTRHLRGLWQRQRSEADDLLPLLREHGRRFDDRPVLIPITDLSVHIVAEHLDELRTLYRIAMPAPALVFALLSKGGIERSAAELGVLRPRTWSVERADRMPVVARRIRYPCIVKPDLKNDAWLRSGARKAYTCASEAELLATYSGMAAVDARAVVQELVAGGDGEVYFCLQSWSEGGELLGSFTGRKIRQWPPDCGGTASCEPTDAPEVERITSDFFRAVGMRGLCSMEFKRDSRDDRFYMIEPTVCRPDWQNAVADLNGVPLAYLSYCDLAGAPLPERRERRTRRRWVHWVAERRSAAALRRRGELGLLRWLWSIRPPVHGAYLSLEDPGPFVAIVATMVRRASHRLFGQRPRGSTRAGAS